jgi:hypothetical protein
MDTLGITILPTRAFARLLAFFEIRQAVKPQNPAVSASFELEQV